MIRPNSLLALDKALENDQNNNEIQEMADPFVFDIKEEGKAEPNLGRLLLPAEVADAYQ